MRLVRYGWNAGKTIAWICATTASATLGWAALQPVLDAAVPDRFTPLTGAELRAQAAPIAPIALQQTPPAAVVTTHEPEPASPEPVPTDPPAPASTPTGGSGGSGGGASSESGASGDSGPPPEASPEVTEDWTVIESPEGTSYVKSFETESGTAVVEVEPGQATLISATPVEPYAVDVYHEDPERVVVQFYVSNHMWVVEAMWWEGAPYGTVTEVP